MSENIALESHIGPAADGVAESARLFYQAFLKGPLYVPERYQQKPLSHVASYPNDFINVLGLQDKDRVLIPVFSRESFIHEWCGQELSFKVVSGAELLKLAPEGWWISLNPTQEVEKELSPWEIDTLRGGEASIDALISELYADDMSEPIEVRAIPEGELPELRRALIERGTSDAAVNAVYLLREVAKNIDGEEVTSLIVGVEVSDRSSDVDQIRSEFQSICDLHLIGGERSRVFAGLSQEGRTLALAIFKDADPIYRSAGKPGMLKRLFGRS